MKISVFRSLPVRLAGFILLLSGAALLILTDINRRAVESILQEQAEIQAMQSTFGVVDGLDAVLGSVEQLTRTVARDLGSRQLTPTEVPSIASNLMLDQASLYGFSIAFEPHVLDANTEHLGIYVHRSSVVNRFTTSDLTTEDQTYWKRDWYREVIDKRVSVWSEPFFDRGATDRDVVRITVPIIRTTNGQRMPIGAVSAIIELNWLRRLVNANEFSDTSYAIIFSRSGKLIIHPNPNYVITETIETLGELENVPQLADIRQQILAKRQGTLSYINPVNQQRVHVNYKPTKIAGWGVIIGYDETEFLKPQQTFRNIAAAYLGATLLLLAGIVIGVTRLALRPLAPLASSASEIANQNLDCAIPEVVRNDEIGLLTRAFRSMRDALKAQHAEQRWASQALKHQLKYSNLIIDSIGELVIGITKGQRISLLNHAAKRATGYTLKEVLRAPFGKVVRLQSTGGVVDDTLLNSVKHGISLNSQPAIVIAKDGTEIPASLTIVPLKDGGKVVGAVATLRMDSTPQSLPI